MQYPLPRRWSRRTGESWSSSRDASFGELVRPVVGRRRYVGRQVGDRLPQAAIAATVSNLDDSRVVVEQVRQVSDGVGSDVMVVQHGWLRMQRVTGADDRRVQQLDRGQVNARVRQGRVGQDDRAFLVTPGRRMHESGTRREPSSCLVRGGRSDNRRVDVAVRDAPRRHAKQEDLDPHWRARHLVMPRPDDRGHDVSGVDASLALRSPAFHFSSTRPTFHHVRAAAHVTTNNVTMMYPT